MCDDKCDREKTYLSKNRIIKNGSKSHKEIRTIKCFDDNSGRFKDMVRGKRVNVDGVMVEIKGIHYLP